MVEVASHSPGGALTQGGETKDGAKVRGRAARRVLIKVAIGASVEWVAIGTTRRDSEGQRTKSSTFDRPPTQKTT